MLIYALTTASKVAASNHNTSGLKESQETNLIPLFCAWDNQGPEKGSNLPRVAQPMGGPLKAVRP